MGRLLPWFEIDGCNMVKELRVLSGWMMIEMFLLKTRGPAKTKCCNECVLPCNSQQQIQMVIYGNIS
jgi:hypothetical protein